MLANELFDAILDYLSFDDLVALASTSMPLMRRMEPRLLATTHQRDKTLICALRRGYCCLVRRALSLGADACAPLVLNREGSFYGQRLNPVLALRLAVKGGDEGAFQALVERGATLEGYIAHAERHNASQANIDAEIDGLLWLLSRPDRISFLRRFCDVSVLPPLRAEHLQNCLKYTIKRSLLKGVWGKHAVNLLVSQGASVCGLQSSSVRGKCPVATAILRGHPDMAEEMLRHGANIQGKEPRPTDGIEVGHIPIFAAACRMATDGPSIVQRFLAWGANPYHQADLRIYSRRMNDSVNFVRKRIMLHTPLPVHMYLASIRWDADVSICHLEGLRFWKSFGPPFDRDRVVLPSGTKMLVRIYWGLAPLLLQKWGPNMLAHTPFYEVMKELQPDLGRWALQDVQHSIFDDRAFRYPEGISLERWEKVFKVKFPAEDSKF
ncbi:hypothetical protein V2A60_002209 [Cordyceps javanica]